VLLLLEDIKTGDIDVGDRCWRSNVLVTSLRCCLPIYYIEKVTNISKKVDNIMILSQTSQISHLHKVTNITMSPKSLSSIQHLGTQFFSAFPVSIQSSRTISFTGVSKWVVFFLLRLDQNNQLEVSPMSFLSPIDTFSNGRDGYQSFIRCRSQNFNASF